MCISIAIILRDLLFCFKLEEYINDYIKQGCKLPLLSTPHPPHHHHCHSICIQQCMKVLQSSLLRTVLYASVFLPVSSNYSATNSTGATQH